VSNKERLAQLSSARERLVAVRRDLEGKIEGVDGRLGLGVGGEERAVGGRSGVVSE